MFSCIKRSVRCLTFGAKIVLLLPQCDLELVMQSSNGTVLLMHDPGPIDTATCVLRNLPARCWGYSYLVLRLEVTPSRHFNIVRFKHFAFWFCIILVFRNHQWVLFNLIHSVIYELAFYSDKNSKLSRGVYIRIGRSISDTARFYFCYLGILMTKHVAIM